MHGKEISREVDKALGMSETLIDEKQDNLAELHTLLI